MKKKNIFGLVAVITIIALNVQWLGWIQDGYLFSPVNAGVDGTIDIGEFDINGIGYDFLNLDEVIQILPQEDVTRTPVVANPTTGTATKLNCPWNCGEEYWFPAGFFAIPEMCTEGDLLILDIQADIDQGRTGNWDGAGAWGANSVYDAGEKVSWDGLWVWDRYNITTGIGWTAWWVGLANYCEANGWWTSSSKGDITYGGTSILTFTIATNIPGPGAYEVDLLAKDTAAGLVRMQGRFEGTVIAGGQNVVSPSFNSPFIYFDNMPAGQYSVALDSEWDSYQSVTPMFEQNSTWDVSLDDDVLTVDNQTHEHLFYELAMHRIDLSRKGVNFDSKQDLEVFLKETDFFANLHMTEEEKQNSLEYLIPRLPDSSNYYLTVLTDESVNSLSEISVEPKPEQLVRTYYAVYPTLEPVQVSGGLEYPQSFDTAKPTVKEYGEIIVKPEMYVFWK